MMSAVQRPSTLESKLKALQCHFTWDINPGRSTLLGIREKLEDIGTEEGNCWLGHIYNLQGYIQYKLRPAEDALSLFNKATEAFRQTRHADSDEGPWLVVNCGNLAWLHHLLGEEAESEAYLAEVDALMTKYPSPSEDELHPEIYAEKAWTLMKFGPDKKQVAEDCFQRAIRMQPDMVEWNTSYVIALVSAYKHSDAGLEDDILEKLRMAKELDPENLYLAAHYLEQCAKKGENIDEDEARELASKVLRNPVSSHSGLTAVLRVFRMINVDEAVDLAERALENHPDVRYLKSCVAVSYAWKIESCRGSPPKPSTLDRAIRLREEVISLYPDSSPLQKIELAKLYAKSSHRRAEAEPIYQELLDIYLKPADRQQLYHKYAKHLYYNQRDHTKSIKYYKKAAEIQVQSWFRKASITALEKIKDEGKHRMCREIQKFLENLPEL